MLDRMCEQREFVPSAGIVDSQSVKAPVARERGYDAHKKISGAKATHCSRYRRATAGGESDTGRYCRFAGGQLVLHALVKRRPWVKHLFSDAAYDRRTLLDKAAYLDFTVEVVPELQGQDGFQVSLDAGSVSAHLHG